GEELVPHPLRQPAVQQARPIGEHLPGRHRPLGEDQPHLLVRVLLREQVRVVLREAPRDGLRDVGHLRLVQDGPVSESLLCGLVVGHLQVDDVDAHLLTTSLTGTRPSRVTATISPGAPSEPLLCRNHVDSLSIDGTWMKVRGPSASMNSWCRWPASRTSAWCIAELRPNA